ncbi:hypothetical protein V5799_006030 [Amblyomma americanum]|uniref:PCFS4-like zinc finger domain-containing protein n=1 Tax=Amblyomma americanum TaxID=6943 RepID=A0AAQ4DXK2_AMBAM
MTDSGGRSGAGRGFHGRGPMQPPVDRFGRPLLRKLMSDPRFRSHMGQPNDVSLQQQQMFEMLADPDMFLQRTEEQLRAGSLNPDLHRELKAELEKISQFRKSQPQSPIVPHGWQGGPSGPPGFPAWNQHAFAGVGKGPQELPPPTLLEPAPAVGTIRVDTKMRKVQFVDDVAVVLMDGSETRQITFKGPPKHVFVDDIEPIALPFDGTVKEFVSKRTGKKRTLKFGAPLREIFLDGVPYSAQFDNSPIAIKTADGEVHVIRLEPPPPTVDIEKRPPEHVLRALNLHPEKLADTDSDLRTLPAEPKVSSADGENSMDIDMRLPAAEAAKDVDLRKRGDIEESGAPWSSPQQTGVGGGGWGQSRPQQPESGFQQRESKESGGWVRYGSASEERTAVNNNWLQQPLGQPQQDPAMRQPWPQGPGEWNSNFGNDFMAVHGMPGVGPGRRGNQQPGFGGKEYPSYFREDFPQPQLHPHHMGVGEIEGSALQAPSQVAPGQPPALDVNVGELFSKLVAAGILKQSAGTGNAAGVQSGEQYQPVGGHLQKKKRRRARGDHGRQEPKKPVEGVPQLSFSRTDQLKIKHPSVINALHVGTQCASCGLRFTDEKCEKYRQHLDWHFRANRRDKDGARKAFSRKWFYEVEDWIQFEEIEDLEERARSFFEQQATVEQDQSTNSPAAIKSVPASGDETGSTCAVCEEAFQLFWAEEEEQWHFKDAVRIENKVYHPACYEDFKRVNFCFILLELAFRFLQYSLSISEFLVQFSKQLFPRLQSVQLFLRLWQVEE